MDMNMTDLNYDISAIKLPSLELANGLLKEVTEATTKVNTQKESIHSKIREIQQKEATITGKVTGFSDITAKAKAMFVTSSDIEALKLELTLLDEYLTDKTGALLKEAGTVASKISTEISDMYKPYYSVMCVNNAAETDAVGLELNRLLEDYVIRYNSLLEQTGWFSYLKNVNPKYEGNPIKPLNIGIGEAVVIKGSRLNDLMEGL
ncbi:hypothetical protein [Vagococcus salmoninarum]|uniref:hypothetical protein n=1 Tax=Vagococcus salmoninarum TaxID=2739 RepID=UPI003F99697C